ncbi:unnamed protein product, partial [Aphanomyces euteiches]
MDVSNCTFVVVPSRDMSYQLILEYVADHLCSKDDHRSYEVDAGKKKHHYWEQNDQSDGSDASTLRAGYGLHRFSWNDHQLVCLRQHIGAPV